MREQAADYRERILETAAEYDDLLMEKYFKGQEISPEECYRALRKATIHHALVPVFCGSSYRNKGVQPLLQAVVTFLPSPMDVGAVKGFDFKSGREDFRLLPLMLRFRRWFLKSWLILSSASLLLRGSIRAG